MKKKLLLISLSAGAGHVRAAEAIRKTAKEQFPRLEVRHIDMADYILLPMKAAVLKSYDLLVKQLPDLWGLLYKKTDNATLSKQFRKVSALMNRMNATALYEYVSAFRPDYILCTHFLPAQALLESGRKIPVRPAILMTDYEKHSFLTYPGMREYFVATERMKFKLAHSGIPAKQIHVTGIPVDPVFTKQKNVASLRKKYGIAPGVPVLLVLSGGQGMAKTDEIVKTLFHIPPPLRIIAIAGSNKNLQIKLGSLTPPTHITLSAIGWTDAIDEYMRLADAIVTKPGGMTTTECIALGKPIIAVQPIPGQEEQNAEYILEHGFGSIAHTTEDLLYYVEKTLLNKNRHSHSTPNNAAQSILRIIQK